MLYVALLQLMTMTLGQVLMMRLMIRRRLSVSFVHVLLLLSAMSFSSVTNMRDVLRYVEIFFNAVSVFERSYTTFTLKTFR